MGLKFNNISFHRNKAIDRRSELWSTFTRIVEYGKKENIDFLLIAGDLFENHYFTIGDISRVRDILKSAENMEIIISAGNHDFIGINSLYNRIEWPKNVSIFGNAMEKKEFKDKNTIIYGYSWDRPIIRENNLFENFRDHIDREKNNILILHGDMASSSDNLPLNLMVCQIKCNTSC